MATKKAATAAKSTPVKPAAARKKAAGTVTSAKVPAKPKRQAPAKPTSKAKVKPKAAPVKRAIVAAPAEADHNIGFITPKQQRFVDEYLIDLNGTQAAIRAKYSPDTAGSQAFDLLKKPEIQAAIARARKLQQERTHISADRVVLEAWNIMTGDARELVQVKTACCRYCHGEGHKYQRSIAEMNNDREQWAEKKKKPADFDELGGIGFNPVKSPHPECPECHGDGWPRVVATDTRLLSPQAQALYAGAKMGKHGIEVQMHDKAAAMEKLFKHLGLYEKDNQQKTDPLTSLLHAIANGNNNGFKPVAADPEHGEDDKP